MYRFDIGKKWARGRKRQGRLALPDGAAALVWRGGLIKRLIDVVERAPAAHSQTAGVGGSARRAVIVPADHTAGFLHHIAVARVIAAGEVGVRKDRSIVARLLYAVKARAPVGGPMCVHARKGKGRDEFERGMTAPQREHLLGGPQVESAAHAGDEAGIVQFDRAQNSVAQIPAQDLEKIWVALSFKAQFFRAAARKTAGMRGVKGRMVAHGAASLLQPKSCSMVLS